MKHDILSNAPRECCLRCLRFGIDAEPRWIRLASGRRIEGWINRCDFAPSQKDPDFLCARFEDRFLAESYALRERFGYAAPVQRTDTATQPAFL